MKASIYINLSVNLLSINICVWSIYHVWAKLNYLFNSQA